MLPYAHFFEMFLEMTVGVGIIILLFEASQAQLQQEMQRLVESDSQVKEMGIRDRLTGLYNRHYFNDVIRRELARSRRHAAALSGLLIDVDRFKEINDVRGQASETKSCSSSELPDRLRCASRPGVSLGRDEFLVLTDPGRRGFRRPEGGGARRSLPVHPRAAQLQPTLPWCGRRICPRRSSPRLWPRRTRGCTGEAQAEEEREARGPGSREALSSCRRPRAGRPITLKRAVTSSMNRAPA